MNSHNTRYYLCGDEPVDPAGRAAANSSGGPRQTRARYRRTCYEDYLEPGELLYYGTDW